MKHNKEAADPIQTENNQVFAALSHYLNEAPDFIKQEEIEEIVQLGVSYEYAFALLLAAALGLDIEDNEGHKELFNRYFTPMVHKLEAGRYVENPYYKHIRIPAEARMGSSELRYEAYKPYEGFVCDDILRTAEGRQIPQIGFFTEEFRFPAVLENGRIWMTITPNEIETMREPVEAAFGKVLTFGLGLGYYAYMVAEKEQVDSVTIVEMNQEVIDLFTRLILPQFKQAHKIRVIRGDAFEYARASLSREKYDYVFTDLWHDVSDGLPMYLRMKQYERESPGTVFAYWIEKSILCYI